MFIRSGCRLPAPDLFPLKPMKHFSFFLTLLLLTACTRDPESGPAPGVGQTPMQEFYIPGVFRIKLRETAAELDTRAFTRSGSGSGIAAFDAAATRAGATAVQRVFSDGDRFRERRRRAGLHLWYDVHFSGAISVAEAMERFGRVDEVECIEPVPRMVPAGATVSQADFSRTSGSDNVANPGFDDPLLVNQWIYHRVGAAVGSTAVADLNIFPAWSVSTGHKDVVVAVVDGGIDFYATQTTQAPDGRRLMTAWLQTWSDTEDKPQGCKWFGQTICPRELHIKDGRILQTPVRELDAVHGKRTFHENVTVQGETSLEGIKGRVADLTVTVQPGEYRSFTLKLAADADHHTSLTYDPYTSELTLDRSYAGSRADIVHRRSCKVRSQNGALKLRILLDKNSVEVFVNDGEQTMTAWIYTPQSADSITFAADGKATVTAEQFELDL